MQKIALICRAAPSRRRPKGGTVLNIPQQLILPDTVHEGIVINSAEMRLYYYPKGTNTVIVLPIGIGQLGKDTPINWTTKVEPHRSEGLKEKGYDATCHHTDCTVTDKFRSL